MVIQIQGVAVTLDNVNNECVTSWNNMSWVASGGNIESDGALIYDDTVASPVIDPIVGYIDFGETILTLDGGTFTITAIEVASQ